VKRTLIFQQINIDEKGETLRMELEATKHTLDVFQIALEHKLQPYGWYLSKVIKPSKRKGG